MHKFFRQNEAGQQVISSFINRLAGFIQIIPIFFRKLTEDEQKAAGIYSSDQQNYK